MSVGLPEQLYEPWVLVQDAFGWHLLILKGCASLHSSTSEREQTQEKNVVEDLVS